MSTEFDILVSTDSAQTFTKIETVAGNFPVPLQLLCGTVLIAFVTDDGDLKLIRSLTGGATWESPETVRENAAVSQLGLEQLYDGRICLFYKDGETTVDYVLHSFDNGTTWSDPIPVM